MIMATRFSLREASEPSRIPRTKFGGQPNWLEQPSWPISTRTLKPMLFLGQIEIREKEHPQMAYLFMCDDPESETFDYLYGGNAVVIQRGEKPYTSSEVLVTGPTVSESEFIPVFEMEKPDPEFIKQSVLEDPGYNPALAEKYLDEVSGMKLGGTPHFLQSESFPSDIERPVLLVQIASESLPEPLYEAFPIGADANLMVFVDDEYQRGRMMWQG